ncbi:vicilin Cor a 11.0101-like [Bidens hawaiensis]|uniref:vicilin Cor a 11.0101-like n=1 Tax=Bidens hawaiensis TaxID=980011 RepID=UPI00404A7468
MEIKGKICFVFLVFVVSATLSFGDQQGIVFAEKEQAVRKIVSHCHQSCQGSQGEQQRPQCFQSCMQKQLRESGKGQSGETYRPETGKQHHQQSNNPYVFEEHDFTTRLETERGFVKFLKKFTQQSDELFKGIEKYRAAILEAEPLTFIQPNHWDADALVFVANGQGILDLIEGNSRKSHNIKQGDLFLVPAGINAYLINTDDNERLVLAKILHSVSVPGELQFFSGGGNADSFFNVFSREVLEAAFGVEQESIGRILFGQQQKGEQGMFKKATPEQIQSFSGEDKGRSWPFGDRKEKNRHTSIYKKEPTVANDNGILHEINSKDFPDLADIRVAFSFFNITQGSMAGPFYNTKTTQVLMVSNGIGRFEMACPHLSEQKQGQAFGGGEIHPRYRQVSSELRQGTVVVIPAGHPVVIEAFGEQNLEVAGFGLNSDENEWFPLAGRDNVMSQWEDAALELTFGFRTKEVQKVIQRQNQKLFFKAPVRGGGRAFA